MVDIEPARGLRHVPLLIRLLGGDLGMTDRHMAQLLEDIETQAQARAQVRGAGQWFAERIARLRTRYRLVRHMVSGRLWVITGDLVYL